jgi:hypothetical protein
MKMKTLLPILTLLSFTSSAFAQNSGDYEELMKQSRKARTTSTILVVVGPVVAVGGVGTLIYGLLANEIDDGNAIYDQNGNFIRYDTKKHTTEIIAGAAGTLIGIGLALTSIHFSNKASELKRDARKTKLKTSTDRISIPGFQNGMANNRSRQFKVSLVIPL